MHRRMISFALAALACGCVDDGITVTDTVNGVKYSARFAPAGIGMNLIATLENVSTATQERLYPATCPVRIRLYRPADGFKMYDETKLSCASDTVRLSLNPGDKYDLASGIRTANYLLGDTLPAQTFVVKGVVQTEGVHEIEVDAGYWTFDPPEPASLARLRTAPRR